MRCYSLLMWIDHTASAAPSLTRFQAPARARFSAAQAPRFYATQVYHDLGATNHVFEGQAYENRIFRKMLSPRILS